MSIFDRLFKDKLSLKQSIANTQSFASPLGADSAPVRLALVIDCSLGACSLDACSLSFNFTEIFILLK